jgi:hypothetical protein
MATKAVSTTIALVIDNLITAHSGGQSQLDLALPSRKYGNTRGSSGEPNLRAFTIPPRCLLEQDSIAVTIFERSSPLPPIGIEGRDFGEPGVEHGSAGLVPAVGFGQIENEQIRRR